MKFIKDKFRAGGPGTTRTPPCDCYSFDDALVTYIFSTSCYVKVEVAGKLADSLPRSNGMRSRLHRLQNLRRGEPGSDGAW